MSRAVNDAMLCNAYRYLCLVFMLLLAGCKSMAPSHEIPALPVAQEFPANGGTVDAAGETAASLGWQDYFADEQLRTLIARSLEHNRDLRMAVLRVEEVRALYGIQRADLYPGLDAAGIYGRSRIPADLSMTGRPLIASEYQAGLGISNWEIDFWGRIRSLKDAALETFLAGDAARRAATLSLISQVADSYFVLHELDERIVIARKTIESREESLRIFKRRFEVGSTSKLDLSQVETLLSQAQTLEYQLLQARASQLNALTVLVGGEVGIEPASYGFDDDRMLRSIRVGLPSDMLIERPDIMAAEHLLKSANANIGAARAAFFPRVTLTGFLGSASTDLDGLFDSGSRAWRFAPSISLPIFDSGRNRANLSLAEVRRDQAVASYEKTIQFAFREVADALAAKQWLMKQIASQQQTLDSQSERARLAKLRYDSGATSYFEVLDAQRDLLTVEQQLVQMRRALLSSQVDLYVALGGGSQSLVTALPVTE